MKKKQVQRFLAGVLCVVMLSGNDGMIGMAATSSELLQEADGIEDVEQNPADAKEETGTSEEKQTGTEEIDEVLTDAPDYEETAPQPEGSDEILLDAASSEGGYIVNDKGELTAYNGTETDIVVPEGVITIKERVFREKTDITSVQLPSTLETIGSYAFENCSGLVSVSFPQGLKTIGYNAFHGVSFGSQQPGGVPVTGSITIPGTVTSVEEGAFRGCKYLGEVVFEEGEEPLLIKSGAYDSQTFGGCPELKRVKLPKRLREIKGYTFANDPKLETVEFNEGLVSIGERAFRGDEKLEEAVFSPGLVSIGKYAFEDCSGLKSVTFPQGLETIDECAFRGAGFGSQKPGGEAETGVLTIPGTVTRIGGGAFMRCPYLGEVVFEEGEEPLLLESDNYDYQTFGGCPELKSVILPKRLRTIKGYAFSKDPLLEIICIPESVVEINERAIYDCPKAVIYGTKGSKAEDYANTYKIPFKDINELWQSVTGVTLQPDKIERVGEDVVIGEQIQLKAVVLPGLAKNKEVTYHSDDEKVATVDSKGLVTLTGYGTTQVTVTTVEGGKTASCRIRVLKEITYKVSFDLQGCGDALPDDMLLHPGSLVLKPEEPKAAGYRFLGWYKDAACTEPWDFAGDAVDADTILYAGWEIDETYNGILWEDLSEQGKHPDGEVWVGKIRNVVYTGQAVTPKVRVYDGSRRLEEGLEYTISYKNNKNVPSASGNKLPAVTVKGKGNYSKFKKTYQFTIEPLDISTAGGILAEEIVTVHTGRIQKSKIPVVKYNGKKLSNNKDFQVSYDGPGDYTKTGSYLVTIRGKGNFTGTLTASLRIIDGKNSTPMSKAKVSISKQDCIYKNGDEVTPVLTVKIGGKLLNAGTDYTVAYENNRRIGTATAVITGTGNESEGYTGTKRVTFKIVGTPLKVKVENIESCTYDGMRKKQNDMKVILKSTGENLKENKDYRVNYSKNINAGKATVTITGINNYSGTVKKTFKIDAYKLTDPLLAVPEQVTGTCDEKGKIHLTSELDFNGRKLVEGRDYTLTYRKKTETVIIKGKGNFKGKLERSIIVGG